MKNREIHVLVDKHYHFSKDNMAIPEQLYPFGPDAAFANTGGSWDAGFKRWEYEVRLYTGYRVVGADVETFVDVQPQAQKEYQLSPNEVFLGAFDGRVFFWHAFDPSRVYWRRLGQPTTFAAAMPREVIDIYGVTKGIHKDVGFVVFARSLGLIQYSPYTTKFVEVSLSKGSPIHAP